MTNEIRFDNSEFTGLGIHYLAQSWTYAEVLHLLDEYVAPGLSQLASLASSLGVEADTKILSTYQSKSDKQTYFSLPRAHLNKEGVFTLFVGEYEAPLIYENKTYVSGNYKFKVVPRRQDAKDPKSKIVAINLVAEFDQEDLESGLEESYKLIIPVRTKKDSDLAAIAKSLQAGDTEIENLVQLGKGSGGLEPYYKPFMLPKGFYRISVVNDPKFLSTGGKILEGTVKSLLDGTEYKVKMNAAPFVVQQRETLLIAAQQGAAVYLYIAGAYQTSVGIGAIAHACRLTERDGVVPPQMWDNFVKDAKTVTAATASKNSNNLLSDAKIAELREEFEANEAARIAEWITKKNAADSASPTVDQAVTAEKATAENSSLVPEEIPF